MNSSTKARPLTPEVRKFLHFNRNGDVIPHGWNKCIGRWHESKSKTTGIVKKVWRSRPFAERLLARIVWFYTPSPIKNTAGEVTGWKRKFKAQFWQMNQGEMAEALGCSRRTIVDELELLRELGLVTTRASREHVQSDGSKQVPLFVIPIYETIAKLGIEDELEDAPSGAGEETSLGAGEVSSLEPVKKLHNSSLLPPSSSSISGDSPQTDSPASEQCTDMNNTTNAEHDQPNMLKEDAPTSPYAPLNSTNPESVAKANQLIAAHSARHQNDDETVRAINRKRNSDEATKAAVLMYYEVLREVMPHKTPNVSAWFARCEVFMKASQGNKQLVTRAAKHAVETDCEPNTPDGLVWAIDKMKRGGNFTTAPQLELVPMSDGTLAKPYRP